MRDAPTDVNPFVWILAESQRIRASAREREAASIRRIEAKQHDHRAQECQPRDRSQERAAG